MNIEEAKKLVASRYTNYVINKVTETNKYFLVSIVLPKKYDSENLFLSPQDGCLKAVDKQTKKIFTYHPIIHG